MFRAPNQVFYEKFKIKSKRHFFNDVDLLLIWRTLTGALFLPLINPEVLNILKSYLKKQIKIIGQKDLIKAKKISDFYSYLRKFYFSENSPFNPGNYDFYNAIIFEGNMTTSTNCLESLNRVLKELSGTGFLPFARVFSLFLTCC